VAQMATGWIDLRHSWSSPGPPTALALFEQHAAQVLNRFLAGTAWAWAKEKRWRMEAAVRVSHRLVRGCSPSRHAFHIVSLCSVLWRVPHFVLKLYFNSSHIYVLYYLCKCKPR